MNLSKEELIDVIAAVKYYQLRHVSVTNPRHEEYEVIMKKLHKTLLDTHE